MKLSDREVVLKYIQEGWEFGFSDASRSAGRYWLQKNGLCKGGESINIHTSTARKMLKTGLIKRVEKREKDNFWLQRFEIA